MHNAVRFGFWGAEELGSSAPRNYVQSLDVDALKDIALYLNFDMIASPNPGYFTYDGDESTRLDPQQSPPRVPEGSAGIERTLVSYLKQAGKTAQDTSFDGRSDYDSFTRAGIPVGRSVHRGGDRHDRRNKRSCGAEPPASRSTRIITRRPTPSTASITPRSTSTEKLWRTRSASTPRICPGATAFPSATTEHGT